MRPNLFPATCLLLLASVFSSSAIAAEPTNSGGIADPSTGACLAHQNEAHAAASLAGRREAMAREIERYQSLVEEALGLRARAIVFHQKLQEKSANRQPLNGLDLQTLNEGAIAMLAQRDALFNIAFQHECWTSKAPSDDPQEAAIQV